MKPRLIALSLFFSWLIFPNQLLADVNVLIIGSTHSYSEGGESGVVHEKPFNPAGIATHLQGILSQDPAITETVNVEFEDIYKTKALSVVYSGSAFSDFTSHCYSLAQHYLWPEGKAARLANLRGEGARVWDYIVICHDPYITANFPGMVAEGTKLIREEVAKSANPAQVVLLAQWPETSSTFTAAQFNEIAYRVGNSAGITVVPAGKTWNSYTSKDTSSSHPTPRGAYLAAASLYSKLYNRSAKTSAYDFPSVGDAIADHALSEVQANAGVAQYSGNYTSFNPFQMKYLTKRVVSYRETGTSTEDRLAQALNRLDDVHRITFNTSGYAGVPGTRWDFNYGRGNDWWEDDKDYEVNPNIHDWVYGFPMHHNNTTVSPTTMPYGIDKHYNNGTTYEDGTDLGIAYNMIRPGTREPDMPESVRAIPIRLLWQKMAEISPGFNPLGDSTHMHPNLNDASAAFMYTLLSGRSPVVAEPAVVGSAEWMQWLGHKIGYETAWQMSHLTTRAPAFRVLPSSTAATNITPTTTETMTVQFANPPQSDVTVDVSISNPNAAIVGPLKLYFTPQNYNVPQNVVVAGLAGSAASESFNVIYTTTSTDEVYHGLSDTWGYQITRSAPVALARVNKATIQVTGSANLPLTINLDTAGSSSSSTVLAGPNKGTVAWSGANIVYTPGSDYLGKDGVAFAVNNAGTLTVGYVEITVVDTVPIGMVSYRGNGSDGGSVPIDSNTYAQSATVTVLGNTGNLIKTGNNFAGWNTAANGSGTAYNPGATFSMGASGVILHAQWTAVPTYTVTYLGNGNNSGTAPPNQTKTDGVNLTLATNLYALAKTSYTFAGWNTATNGTGTDYAAGGTYSGNADLTLYAKWTPNNYTVTFNANGGSTPTPANKVVTFTSTYGTLASVSYVGYSFTGWFTAATGGTQVLSTTTVTNASNHTLFAQWTSAATYTVSYHANTADSGTVPADQTKLHDAPLVLATNTGSLTKAGFTFGGWNTATNGSGTNYPAGGNYTANVAVTLYARWNTLPVVNAGSDQSVTLSPGSAWNPSQLTPQLWLDADDTNTITLNGPTVSQWTDKSGFNRHATATGTAQPTATAAGLDGKRVVTFDGSTDVLSVNLDFLAGVSHSAFVVTKPTAFNNIYGAANGSAGANSLHVGFNGSNYRMNFWGNDYAQARTANFVAASANIMNFIWIPSTSKQILANGKLEGTSTSPVPGTIGTMSGGGRIGSAVGQGFFGGDIAEFIAVTGAVSVSDRQKMEGYLAHKWGLEGQLAEDHPHKSAPPGAATAVATLDATATDSDPLTYSWTVVSGPAAVLFGNATAIDTTATFSVAGAYTLRLTADDGSAQVSDDIVITVSSPGALDHFAISTIASPQTVGTAITGITLTAQDASNNTVSGFTGTVTFGGTAGITGTSANFIAGVLSGVSATPTVAGSNLSFTVTDGVSGKTGTATIAAIQTQYQSWSGGAVFNADANGDGISNGMAWVLGVADTAANAGGLIKPVFDNTSDLDYIIYTYRRSDVASADANTTIAAEYTSALGGWTTAVHDGVNVIITSTNDGAGVGVDLVQVKIKRTLAVSGQIFVRLKVISIL